MLQSYGVLLREVRNSLWPAVLMVQIIAAAAILSVHFTPGRLLEGLFFLGATAVTLPIIITGAWKQRGARTLLACFVALAIESGILAVVASAFR